MVYRHDAVIQRHNAPYNVLTTYQADRPKRHSADSGHVAADVAGDRRAQHLCVGALGGSDRAASSIHDRGGDELTR